MKKVELLIKPTSHSCNLDCGYCFYKKTSRIYPGKSHCMSEDVLEKLISETMLYSEGAPCTFSWQGGEPLLAGINFFKKIIKFQQKYGQSGQIVSNSVQTNGTLLNKEWIELFRQYNVFVGISLDGPEKLHNRYRKYPSGKGSFKKVLEGIKLLKEGRVEFNILSTIGKDTASDPAKLYSFFLSRELYYLQFIPALDRKREKVANFSIEPAQYGDFLCGLFDVWWNYGTPLASIRLFDNIIELLLQSDSSSCMFKETCGEYIVVEFNGDVYPCDFFVYRDLYLGNIFKNSIAELFEKAKSKFGQMKKVSPEECTDCEWNFICHNGCLWFRWVKKGNLTDKDYLCESYRKFFPYTLKRFKKISDAVLCKNISSLKKTNSTLNGR